MSEDLKKMKVTIEGDTKSLKKEMGSARQETRRSSAVIRKEIEKIKQSMSGKLPKVPQNIKVGAPFSAMAQDVKQYVKEAQLAAGIKVHTEEYEQTERDIERVSQSLEGLKQKKRDLMNSSGGTERSKAIANVKEQIAAAEQQLEKYQAHRQYMQFSNTDSERAYTGKLSDGNSFETAGAVMKQTAERIREVKEATAETLKQIPVLGRVLSNAAYIGSKGWGGLKKLISGVGSGVKSLASGAIQKSSGAFGALIQKFSSGIPTLKRTRSSFNGLGTSGKGLAGILKTVGMTAKFMFASFVIRGAINGAKQGFQNLAQYSGSTNSSISMLMSSLTQLKNSLAAAFAPILEVVAPILNSFVQMIIRAVNAVGQLIGALTGKTTIVTAKKLNQDYAKSLSGTSSGLADNANNADKASKATEKYKRTIMGFDQINKMDDDSSSDSSGGGSSAGNLGGLSDASNMFQTTTVTNQFKDLAKLIKDAWKNADFTELGSIVGEKLNAALEKIPWKKIQNTCNKIAKSIATFLNGFLETTNWKLVGSTIAKGLNTAFGFVNTFAKNFHWKSLGRAISDGINGAVKSFDAALAGQAISNTVKGILDTIIVAIENTDWQQVGEKVREVLVNIDWKGIVSRLSEAIGAAFGGFAAFIGGLIGDAFTSAKEYFEGKIEECGGNVVLGIFKGIIDAIKGIAAWIKDNIFTPFIDGFKNAFGIHSPSTVMRQQGIYIIEGLLEGAKNKLSDLLSWFGQLPGKIKAKLGDAKAWIKSKGSDAIQGLKSGWEAVKESRFLKYVANMKNEVFTKIGNIKEKVTSKGNDIVSGMKNGFSSHWSSFTETLGNIPSKISKAIPNLFSIGKNAIQGFANGFGSVHIPLPHVSVSWNRHSVGPVSFSTPSFGLNWYAKGGFPENGEMFIARENGPEMVGRMGSRNTVANNNQIIEGIKKGVFEAVVEAFDMSGSMNNDKDKDVIVNLTIKADSETLYKVVRKGQKKYDNRYHVVATI